MLVFKYLTSLSQSREGPASPSLRRCPGTQGELTATCELRAPRRSWRAERAGKSKDEGNERASVEGRGWGSGLDPAREGKCRCEGPVTGQLSRSDGSLLLSAKSQSTERSHRLNAHGPISRCSEYV